MARYSGRGRPATIPARSARARASRHREPPPFDFQDRDLVNQLPRGDFNEGRFGALVPSGAGRCGAGSSPGRATFTRMCLSCSARVQPSCRAISLSNASWEAGSGKLASRRQRAAERVKTAGHDPGARPDAVDLLLQERRQLLPPTRFNERIIIEPDGVLRGERHVVVEVAGHRRPVEDYGRGPEPHCQAVRTGPGKPLNVPWQSRARRRGAVGAEHPQRVGIADGRLVETQAQLDGVPRGGGENALQAAPERGEVVSIGKNAEGGAARRSWALALQLPPRRGGRPRGGCERSASI